MKEFVLGIVGVVVVLSALFFGVDYIETYRNAPPNASYAGKVLHSERSYNHTLIVTDKGNYSVIGEFSATGSRAFVHNDTLWISPYGKWVSTHIELFDKP